jgi:Ca2+-binding RTX toxin-like protein
MVVLSRIVRILFTMIVALFLVGIGCGGDDDSEPPEYTGGTGGSTLTGGTGGSTLTGGTGGSTLTGGTGGSTLTGGTGGFGSVIRDAGRADGSSRPTIVDAGRFDGGR